jgi:hypothetical protein
MREIDIDEQSSKNLLSMKTYEHSNKPPAKPSRVYPWGQR